MIAIVGATGVVGRKIFEGLIDNGYYNLILFASKNSNGKILEYKSKKYVVYTLNQENLKVLQVGLHSYRQLFLLAQKQKSPACRRRHQQQRYYEPSGAYIQPKLLYTRIDAFA